MNQPIHLIVVAASASACMQITEPDPAALANAFTTFQPICSVLLGADLTTTSGMAIAQADPNNVLFTPVAQNGVATGTSGGTVQAAPPTIVEPAGQTPQWVDPGSSSGAPSNYAVGQTYTLYNIIVGNSAATFGATTPLTISYVPNGQAFWQGNCSSQSVVTLTAAAAGS